MREIAGGYGDDEDDAEPLDVSTDWSGAEPLPSMEELPSSLLADVEEMLAGSCDTDFRDMEEL